MEASVIKAFEESIQDALVGEGTISLSGDGKRTAVVSSTWRQRNVHCGTTTRNQLVQLFDLDSLKVTTLHASDNSLELMSSYSPSFNFRCVIRIVPPSENNPKKKQLLEIWQGTSMKKLFDLTALDLHGDIYADGEFGCLEWSPCETKIMFTAEKKKKKSAPFLPIPSKPSEDVSYGTEYDFVDEWGEGFVGKSESVLAVCDLKEDKVSIVSQPEMPLGPAQFASDGSIVCVGWETFPHRFGKLFCTNRASRLLHVTPSNVIVTLRKGCCILHPKFSGDGSKLIWFEREHNNTHNSCLKLMKMDWSAKTISTVVDIVQHNQLTVNNETFYGIFNPGFGKCWLSDNTTVIISCMQRASTRLYAINVDTKEINDITDCSSNDESFSCGVLDVQEDLVLAWKSSLMCTPSLLIGRFIKSTCAVEWTTLIESKVIVPDYTVDVVRLESESTPSSKSFSAIYYGPKSGKSVPLIVSPHGGPHSASANSYNAITTFFGKLNVGVLYVNFSGSLGAGEAFVKSLIGFAGTTDVIQCHQATLHILHKYSDVLSKDKVFLFGGSYGGYLVLQLAAQYPEFYKGVSARNPIVDSLMSLSSDVCDCLFEACGLKYDNLAFLDEEKFKVMKESSALARVNNVTCPTLLLLGKNDLRVPYHQGLAYYYALKANGVPTRVLTYNDNHTLNKTPHDVDLTINSAIWFFNQL